MKSICDLVAERVALGEDLGDAADHAATCDACKRVVAISIALADRPDADPGIGFTARITAGAQHRIVVRRRRRIAVGAGAMLAVAAALMLVVLRWPDPAPVAVAPQPALDPWKPHEPMPRVDPDVRALVHLANVERSSHLSAHWGRIEKPLAPYRAVLKGSAP